MLRFFAVLLYLFYLFLILLPIGYILILNKTVKLTTQAILFSFKNLIIFAYFKTDDGCLTLTYLTGIQLYLYYCKMEEKSYGYFLHLILINIKTHYIPKYLILTAYY